MHILLVMVKNLNSSGEIIKIAGDRKFGEHCMTDINDEKLDWFKEAQRYNTYLHDYDKQKKKGELSAVQGDAIFVRHVG